MSNTSTDSASVPVPVPPNRPPLFPRELVDLIQSVVVSGSASSLPPPALDSWICDVLHWLSNSWDSGCRSIQEKASAGLGAALPYMLKAISILNNDAYTAMIKQVVIETALWTFLKAENVNPSDLATLPHRESVGDNNEPIMRIAHTGNPQHYRHFSYLTPIDLVPILAFLPQLYSDPRPREESDELLNFLSKMREKTSSAPLNNQNALTHLQLTIDIMDYIIKHPFYWEAEHIQRTEDGEIGFTVLTSVLTETFMKALELNRSLKKTKETSPSENGNGNENQPEAKQPDGANATQGAVQRKELESTVNAFLVKFYELYGFLDSKVVDLLRAVPSRYPLSRLWRFLYNNVGLFTYADLFVSAVSSSSSSSSSSSVNAIQKNIRRLFEFVADLYDSKLSEAGYSEDQIKKQAENMMKFMLWLDESTMKENARVGKRKRGSVATAAVTTQVDPSSPETFSCSNCSIQPILGPHFVCSSCPNSHFCTLCRGKAKHDPSHRLTPLQPFRLPIFETSSTEKDTAAQQKTKYGGAETVASKLEHFGMLYYCCAFAFQRDADDSKGRQFMRKLFGSLLSIENLFTEMDCWTFGNMMNAYTRFMFVPHKDLHLVQLFVSHLRYYIRPDAGTSALLYITASCIRIESTWSKLAEAKKEEKKTVFSEEKMTDEKEREQEEEKQYLCGEMKDVTGLILSNLLRPEGGASLSDMMAAMEMLSQLEEEGFSKVKADEREEEEEQGEGEGEEEEQ